MYLEVIIVDWRQSVRARWRTDQGQWLRVHDETPECAEHGCVVHHPTDPHQDWPTAFVWSTRTMVRTCPHGCNHIDLDDRHYQERLGRREVGAPCGCRCHCCETPATTSGTGDFATDIARALGLVGPAGFAGSARRAT